MTTHSVLALLQLVSSAANTKGLSESANQAKHDPSSQTILSQESVDTQSTLIDFAPLAAE
jgi:hypothetical protein